MDNNILNYLGSIHAGYLHDCGKISTHKCIELLDLKPNENVLDVGFGTGATLVQLASQNKNINCFGSDISEVMYKKALDRIWICGLSKRIKLTLLKEKNKFPYPDNTFDKVYAESIIAIQEEDDFVNLLIEIKRVMKPDGVFIVNETIWLESTDIEAIKQINNDNKRLYGIVQSNHDFPYLKDWEKLFSEIGFQSIFKINVSEIKPIKQKRLSTSIFRSNIYSLIGKIKSYLIPSLIKERIRYEKAMLENTYGEKMLEGIILKACNKKNSI
jgi:ubiquinone/menaquinone biosynthesis C-methylase UbiE